MTKSNKAYSYVILPLNVTTLSLATYLGILWVSDVMTKDTFMVKDLWWRSGSTCLTAYGFSLFFTMSSKTFTLLLSLSRLMVICHPLDSNFKRGSFVRKVVLISYVVFLLLSVTVTSLTDLLYGEIDTKFCIPFFNTTKIVFQTGLLWCLIVFHFLSTLATIFMYIATVLETVNPKPSLNKTNKRDNTGTIVQLTLILLSTLLCWLSANIIFVTCAFLRTYALHLVPWSIVTLIPINSLLIPVILVSFMMKQFPFGKNKQFPRCCVKSRKQVAVTGPLGKEW